MGMSIEQCPRCGKYPDVNNGFGCGCVKFFGNAREVYEEWNSYCLNKILIDSVKNFNKLKNEVKDEIDIQKEDLDGDLDFYLYSVNKDVLGHSRDIQYAIKRIFPDGVVFPHLID